jgi:hypothetical protein
MDVLKSLAKSETTMYLWDLLVFETLLIHIAALSDLGETSVRTFSYIWNIPPLQSAAPRTALNIVGQLAKM